MTTVTAPPKPSVHDGFAIASLVLSLLWLGGLGALLGIIFGIASNKAARQAGRGSSGMAVAGILLGILGLLLIVILAVVLASHSGASPVQQWIDCTNSNIQNGTDTFCPTPGG